MNFAIIKNDKVHAIISIFPTNWQQFDDVVVCNRNVQIGDDYIMGEFYRDGNRVLSPEEERLIRLDEETTEQISGLLDDIEELCEEIIG